MLTPAAVAVVVVVVGFLLTLVIEGAIFDFALPLLLEFIAHARFNLTSKKSERSEHKTEAKKTVRKMKKKGVQWTQ